MSIPLDRLYHYIESMAEKIHGDCVVIYRFYPHGSKNIDNLILLRDPDWTKFVTAPHIYCNDQEPLNWDFYNKNSFDDNAWNRLLIKHSIDPWPNNNLWRGFTFYNKSILVHSEKQSIEADLYQQNNFILVYYWSHAIIALDWFRFAEQVNQKKTIGKKFLIYNRAWSGTREYRLKFLELLVNSNLQNYCQTKISTVDQDLGVHYSLHNFKNSLWAPNLTLEDYFPINCVPSHYSADFELNDYEQTDIEVVLETLFDDSRLHLTEKSLRPIACGQPFILVSTVGSLKYLRTYGFKTYESIWNEDYDEIGDPIKRLNAIVDLMNNIANWDNKTRKFKLAQAQKIANYNKKYFFSKTFFSLITNELNENLSNAITEIEKNNVPYVWLERRQKLSKIDALRQILTARIPWPDFNDAPEFWSTMTRKNIAKVIAKGRTVIKSKKNSA